jgi:two-component system sensor kinase FixL
VTSWVTVVWSAIASACLALAAVHALIGLRQRDRANLLFAVNSLSVAAIAAFELAMMRAATPAEYGSIQRWIHVPIFVLVASFVLFVRVFFRAGSSWLGWAVIAARGAALVVNFLRRPNLNFVEISSLVHVRLLGEDVSVARGVVSRWTRLGESSSLLLLLFLISAAATVWRRGERRRAAIVGGSMVFFVLAAAGHVALVHAGVVVLPWMVSVPYLGIVASMGYELTSDVLHAAALARALQESQEALRQSARHLALAADAADLGFWAWDAGTDEMWMTPIGRERRGLAPQERLDLARFLSVVHPEDREKIRVSIKSAVDGEGGFEREYRVVRPDGEIRWVTLRGAGERDAEDRRVRVRGISIDVTRQKRAELEAQRRQSEVAHLSRVTVLGELSGSLAHEINQPLTAILSNAQTVLYLVEQDGTGSPDVREILADIVHEGKHAAEVIQRIRLLLKKGEVRPEALELSVLVDDVAHLIRGDLALQGVAFSSQIPAGLPRVRGDRVQIEQVLLNLLTNGCDSMADADPHDRRLVLAAMVVEGGEVRVSVADRGPGIAPLDLERVFEPFVTTKSRGLGLGLSVCRTIVTAHTGRLWAVNNDDRGATFHFTLPVFAPERG